MKKSINILILFAALFLISGCYFLSGSDGGGETDWKPPRKLNPDDVALPKGYAIEIIARGLTFPTDLTFDDEENIFVIEAGYSYGEVFTKPKLIKIDSEGKTSVVFEGENNGPWTSVDFYKSNFYISEGGTLKGGRIIRIDKNGKAEILIDSLPSLGDHHTNGVIIGPDEKIYFGIGTATNSGVVGVDNFDFGWLKRNPQFYDIPCNDVKLSGKNFKSENPLKDDGKVETGAFSSFGKKTSQNEIIKGKIPCSGAILRSSLNGENLELVAWGFRNPFGISFNNNDELFVTDNGFDERGSRPVWGTGDLFWKIENGLWYGWPDFSGDHKLHDVDQLLAEHPNQPPKPVAKLGVHSSSNGFDFSNNNEFGYLDQAFIAQFGDQAPTVGKVLSPVGFKVIRVDTKNGNIYDFAVNKGKTNAPASYSGSGGLERPVAVKFSPDGKSLYIVDFGIMQMSDKGPMPKSETGVIWKVTKNVSD